jgi:hypothetical protein
MEARRASFALFDSSRSRDAPVNYLVYPYVEVNGKPWKTSPINLLLRIRPQAIEDGEKLAELPR